MRRLLFTLLLAGLLQPAFAQSASTDCPADLEALRRLIETEHVRPYWKTSPETFAAVYAAARERVRTAGTDSSICLTELLRVVAAVRDGHSGIRARDRYARFGYLPFTAKDFAGELYLTRIASAHRQYLGYRIVAVGDWPIERVRDALRTVVPHANESRLRKFIGAYLHLPGLLYGLGITDDPRRARFTLADANGTVELVLEDLPPDQEAGTAFAEWQPPGTLPAWFQRQRDRYYWFDYDERERLLYFQYNRIGNAEEESSTAFAERLWAVADSVPIDKFVLDLRYNGGGSFPYALKFLQGILDRPHLNRRGKLFVVTGHETFSAAILLLNELEQRSQAILIGEPPCDHPASPGDSETYTLSRTGIGVNLSQLFHRGAFPADGRTATQLDRSIETTWADYRIGRDPVLEYIGAYPADASQAVPAAALAENLGRYDYSPLRHLVLRERAGEAELEIARSLITPLYATDIPDRYATEVAGLEVAFGAGRLTLHRPDGQIVSYARRSDPTPSPIELLYAGQVIRAAPLLEQLKATRPDYLDLQDHRMSFLASIAYFALRDDPTIDAAAVARQILELGIRLNEEDAPFCEFSLQFY